MPGFEPGEAAAALPYFFDVRAVDAAVVVVVMGGGGRKVDGMNRSLSERGEREGNKEHGKAEERGPRRRRKRLRKGETAWGPVACSMLITRVF